MRLPICILTLMLYAAACLSLSTLVECFFSSISWETRLFSRFRHTKRTKNINRAVTSTINISSTVFSLLIHICGSINSCIEPFIGRIHSTCLNLVDRNYFLRKNLRFHFDEIFFNIGFLVFGANALKCSKRFWYLNHITLLFRAEITIFLRTNWSLII